MTFNCLRRILRTTQERLTKHLGVPLWSFGQAGSRRFSCLSLSCQMHPTVVAVRCLEARAMLVGSEQQVSISRRNLERPSFPRYLEFTTTA